MHIYSRLKEGGKNLCPTGFATARQVSAQILDNIIAVPICTRKICLLPKNYEHMNIGSKRVRVCDFRSYYDDVYIVKNITPMSGMCMWMRILMQTSPKSLFVRQYVGPHNGQFRKNSPQPSAFHSNFMAYNKNITLLKLILLENMETNEDVNRVRIILLLQ